MRIIITAGSDRTGKSTLTNEFVKRGYEYKHFGQPSGSPYSEYDTYIRQLEKNRGIDGKYVIDRFMYCEFPYSKHYGRNTDMTFSRMHSLEDRILALDPLATVIYCVTDLQSNWKRIESEGKHEFTDIGQLEALRAEYNRVLLNSKLNVVEYNFMRGDTPENTVAKVDTI